MVSHKAKKADKNDKTAKAEKLAKADSNSQAAIDQSAATTSSSSYNRANYNSQEASSQQTVQQAASRQASTTAVSRPQQSASVLDQFLSASGLQSEDGDQYMVQDQGNGNYQVEVRHTGANQDQNVANLKGLYRFNSHTQQVQKMDVQTGQFN